VPEGNLGQATGSGSINTSGSSDADGWYITLESAAGADGAERNVTDPLATPIGVVFYTTAKPSTDVCTFGGKSYIWAVKYDTGGTVPAGVLKGKAMIQLSTGAIQEIPLSTAFNEQGNRRTGPGEGLPPTDQSLNVPIAPKPLGKILHMQKK
jgi:type IV pilus assembly protein PilY1